MKKAVFIKNAVILTVSSLILRFAGIIFKIWIAKLLGGEGVGLYQLIFSFYMLASTFTSGGIIVAVTRLVSEELAVGSKKGVNRILIRSLSITLIVAAVSVFSVFFGAEFVAKTVIGDMRAVSSLKILSLSLPFMGISACFKGYFLAVRRVSSNAFSQIFEQTIRIIVVLILIKRFILSDLTTCCTAVFFGDTLAEICSCGMLFFCFKKDKRKLKFPEGSTSKGAVTKRILHISVPITSGRYLNTALRTAENSLVPKNLALYPFSSASALSQFGMIKGMALPVLFFPSTLLHSVSALLMPEMSEAAAKKQSFVVSSVTKRILRLTALTAFVFSAIFFVAGDRIGILIYNSPDVGFLLKALSPIVPFMYLDSVCDGMLKGLDQQGFCFRTAVCDSILRILLIPLVLPRFGLSGFIGIMYFSNFLTCFLNIRRLLKVSGVKFRLVLDVLFPLFSAFAVAYVSGVLLMNITRFGNIVYLFCLTALCVGLYIISLILFGTVKKSEILYLLGR